MLAAQQEAGLEKAADVPRGYRPVGDTFTVDLDFHQRFQPAHAPGTVSHQRDVVAPGAGENSGRDFVGAKGNSGRLARHENAHAHVVPLTSRSKRSASTRP